MFVLVLRWLALGLATALFVACANSSSDSKGPSDANGPDPLSFQPPKANKPLTEEQKQNFKSVSDSLKNTANITDPADLVIVPADETWSQRNDRMQKRQKASAPAKQLMATLESSTCAITQPAHRETETGAKGNEGWTQTSNQSHSIRGVSCPISLESSQETVSTLQKIESRSPVRIRMGSTINSKQTLLVRDESLVASSGVREFSMQMTSANGLSVYREDTVSWTKIPFNLSIKYVLANREVITTRGTMTIQASMPKANSAESSSEIVADFVMSTRGTDYVFAMHFKTEKGQIVASEIYLNGERVDNNAFPSPIPQIGSSGGAGLETRALSQAFSALTAPSL